MRGDPMEEWDVVVAGGGNAALCAAVAAAEGGARTLLVERAPEEERGGNSRFTDGAIRFAYSGADDVTQVVGRLRGAGGEPVDVGSYDADSYFADLIEVSGGRANETLCVTLAERSLPTLLWMKEQGVRFELLFDQQAFRVDGEFRFWGGLIVRTVGKGRGLVDSLYVRAQERGVEVMYGVSASGLETGPDGAVRRLVVKDAAGEERRLATRAIVLACGGFEADEVLRAQHLGEEWRDALVRGTRFNTGDGLRIALEAGAKKAGQWSGSHAVATDAGSPPFGDPTLPGDIFKKHSYPLGLIINREGRRFVDEGADFRNYTYARYGREVLRQPGGIAYQIFDARVHNLLRKEYGEARATREEAGDIRSLAGKLGLDPDALERTVDEYNRGVRDGDFNPAVLDGKGTEGVDPPKTNWALPLDTPPFLGFPVRCGITFTFGGVSVDATARVLGENGEPIPGLFAAGEMVGGLFYDNYPGGSGLMSGSVFGRIAGTEAARSRE